MQKPSSFQRKVKGSDGGLPGCYRSLYTHHILTSTGVPDLDNIIGGGLPLGTLLLVEEDWAGSYAKLLLKYFLAEGVHQRHALHLTSLSQDPDAILENLPSVQANDQAEQSAAPEAGSDEKMKIAWRYQNISQDSSGGGAGRTKHTFNLLKSVDKEVLQQCDLVSCDLKDETNSEPKSVRLLRKLYQHCEEKGFLVDQQNKEKVSPILRIGVQSLGDILWGETDQQILTFLLALKALLRNCYGVALLTLPPSLQENSELRERLQSCGDIVVSLKSFDGEWTVNPAYKDYHGILCVERISCLGVLTPPLHLVKDNNETVFKSKRNRFLIENFHLPPDLSETVSRDQKDPKLKKNIDF